MNSLRSNGIKNIEGMEFHDIEGGFGEGKKALLVKEIANIHGRERKVINQAINMNKERFKEGVDIVDLKSVNWIDRDLLNDLGFSNSSIANANHIYSLSERGYSKLLKILEDDFAKVKDFNFALEVMNNYKIATALKNGIAMLNNQSQ